MLKLLLPCLLLIVNQSCAQSLTKKKCNEYISSNGQAGEGAKYPHMVIFGFGKENITWACKGFLISDNYALTAAHCTTSPQLGPLSLVRIINDKRKEKVEDISIKKIIAHPEYSQRKTYNDIALIELSKKVEFNRNVQAACLSTEVNVDDLIQKNTPLITIGTAFDVVDYKAKAGDPTQSTTNDLKLIPYADCDKVYGSVLVHGIDRKTQVCAGTKVKLPETEYVCRGNSGSPLQYEEHNVPVVIGLVSQGKSCYDSTEPSIFTKIDAYVPWIEKIVWQNN